MKTASAAAVINKVLAPALRKYAAEPTPAGSMPPAPNSQPKPAVAPVAPVAPLSADQLARRPGNTIGQPAGGNIGQPAGGNIGQPAGGTAGQPGGLQIPPNNDGVHSQARNFGQQIGDAAHGVAQNWHNMPTAAKVTVGGGLGLGALGMMQGGNMGAGLGALGVGAAGLAGAGMGLFGDDARRMVGQGAVNVAGFFGHEIPTADKVRGALDPNGGGEQATAVQAAMNATNEQGQVGGWAAGQAAIDKHKAGLGHLMGMGRDMGTTALMGLQGEGAPQTAEEAGQMYDQLSAKHQEISDPKYLYNQAMAQGRLQAKEQGAGKAVKLRQATGNDPLVNKALDWWHGAPVPQGNNEDEMVSNELKTRYGEYPMPTQDKASAVIKHLLHKFAAQKLVRHAAGSWAHTKQAKACTGKTTMTETASSRGETKLVDDKQKSTNSPKPEDAGATQTNTNN